MGVIRGPEMTEDYQDHLTTLRLRAMIREETQLSILAQLKQSSPRDYLSSDTA